MAILLTNDDGINAPGLLALTEALAGLDELYVCAPAHNHSGAGCSISLGKKVRALRAPNHPACAERWAVEGTPADAVKWGLQQLLAGRRPRLVASGINLGPNIGVNIRCSGTVGAALEGVIGGVSALAVSVEYTDPAHWNGAQAWARTVCIDALKETRWRRTPFLWNLNVPAKDPGRIRGLRVAPHGIGGILDIFAPHPDGDGSWRLEGQWADPPAAKNKDLQGLQDGWAVLTPLQYDVNDYDALERLRGRWRGKGQRKRT